MWKIVENGAAACCRHRLCKSLGHACATDSPQSAAHAAFNTPFPSPYSLCVATPFARCKSQQTLKSTHSAGRSRAGRTQGRGSAHCIGVHFMMQNMLDEHVEAESEAQLGWHRRRRSETFFDTLWKAESSRKLLENIKYAFNISL